MSTSIQDEQAHHARLNSYPIEVMVDPSVNLELIKKLKNYWQAAEV
jgi:hypothetical protein